MKPIAKELLEDSEESEAFQADAAVESVLARFAEKRNETLEVSARYHPWNGTKIDR